MTDQFLGEIRMFAGPFAPRNWAFCDGQDLPVAQYTALFSLLGITYGGDGRSSFGLPDLRGRLPMQFGQGPGLTNRKLGAATGFEAVALATSQMPIHNHPMRASNNAATQPGVEGHVLAREAQNYYDDTPENISAFPDASIGTAGNDATHTNLMPALCLNFIIALQGEYPSRS